MAKPVAVFDDGLPASELSGPRADVVVDSDIAAEDVATPAVMIARHPKNRDPAVHEVRQCGEDSEGWPRDDRSPLEPELEQVAVDHERARMAAQMAQE